QKGKSGRLALLSSSVLLLALFLLYAPVSLAGALVPAAFLVLVFQRGEEVSYILREAWPALAAFALLFVISALISDFPDRVSKASYDFMRGMMVFVLARHVAAAVPSRVFMALYVPLLWCTAWGLVAWMLISGGITGLLDSELWEQVLKIDFSRNVVATELVLWCLPAFALFANAGRDDLDFWTPRLWVPLGLVLGLILLSHSRGTWLAFIAVMLACLVWRGYRRVVAGCVLALAIGGVAAVVFLEPAQVKVWLGTDLFRGGDILGGREGIYHSSWGAFLASPWFGFGAGTFKLLPFAGGFVHPHMIYLELLVSVGMVGAIILTWGLWRLTRVRLLLPSPPFYARLGGLILLFFLVRGIFDIRLFGFESWFMLFAALGLLARPAHGARSWFGP
ncbi:MAG: O-antigen ligase family protein, partial [Gammaproteobacteria bacterium]|nr:O-antigen ligase family protein [Gammaproteobacteria bacterium]